MSGYHGSKNSGSQQYFLDRDGHLSVIMRRKVTRVIFSVIFSVISAGPRFVEIQKPWQPRQRDVTTSPLLKQRN